jgi:hypothetical protein
MNYNTRGRSLNRVSSGSDIWYTLNPAYQSFEITILVPVRLSEKQSNWNESDVRYPGFLAIGPYHPVMSLIAELDLCRRAASLPMIHYPGSLARVHQAAYTLILCSLEPSLDPPRAWQPHHEPPPSSTLLAP